MVATLTPTCPAAAHWVQCSAKVASGWAATWARTAASASAPILRGPPGEVRGASSAPTRDGVFPAVQTAGADAGDAGDLNHWTAGRHDLQQSLTEIAGESLVAWLNRATASTNLQPALNGIDL